MIANIIEITIFKCGPTNSIGLVLGLIGSVLIYLFLQQYLSNLIKEEYENNNHISTSLCYLDILLAFIAIISSSSVKMFNVNLGFIASIYIAMYTGRSYKNIYSVFYSLCAMLILLLAFNVKESLFIPFIGTLYFISSIYLMITLNAFLTILLFTNQMYSLEHIISIMIISILFELMYKQDLVFLNNRLNILTNNFNIFLLS